jgi:hypothetical protein
LFVLFETLPTAVHARNDIEPGKRAYHYRFFAPIQEDLVFDGMLLLAVIFPHRPTLHSQHTRWVLLKERLRGPDISAHLLKWRVLRPFPKLQQQGTALFLMLEIPSL